MMAPAAAPSPWDIAFGSAFTTDYVCAAFRSRRIIRRCRAISSSTTTSTTGSSSMPASGARASATGFADAEFDISGGVRFTFGNFGLDLGYVYYDYPGGINACSGLANGSFGEFYAKPSYKVADWLTIGAIFELAATTSTTKVLSVAVRRVGRRCRPTIYAGNAVITLPWTPGGRHHLAQSGSRPSSTSARASNVQPRLPRATPTGTSASTSTTRSSRSICVTGTPTSGKRRAGSRPGFIERPASAITDLCERTLRRDAQVRHHAVGA